MTLKKAAALVAKETDRTESNVKEHYRRSGGNPEKTHGASALTQKQEKIVLSMCIVYSAMQESLSVAELQWIVGAEYNLDLGRVWANRFIKRYKEDLTARQTKLLSSKRTDARMAAHIKEFICQVGVVSEVYPMTADNTFNYDETVIWVGDNGTMRLVHASYQRAQKHGPRGKSIGSMISFVCADGSVAMSVWIFKAKGMSDDIEDNELNAQFTVPDVPAQARPRRGDWPRFYAYTETGYSNTVLHAAIMGKFCDIWAAGNPARRCYVFGDQLGAHKSVSMVRDALRKRVMCWLLPANASHFIQPLDDAVFARFKQILGRAGGKLRLRQDATTNEIVMAMFQAAFEAEKEAFTDRIIIRSFANTGIFPFSPARILHLADLNSGKMATETRAEHVQVMINSVSHLFCKDKKKTAMKQGKVRVQASTLFSPFELLAAHELEETEKANKAKAKADAKEKEARERAAKRLARTCLADGCTTRTRIAGGAKSWSCCLWCEGLFCLKHKTYFPTHVAACKDDAVLVTEGDAVDV